MRGFNAEITEKCGGDRETLSPGLNLLVKEFRPVKLNPPRD
jgi:hypothetical protein